MEGFKEVADAPHNTVLLFSYLSIIVYEPRVVVKRFLLRIHLPRPDLDEVPGSGRGPH
jgi:hypothetical protein